MKSFGGVGYQLRVRCGRWSTSAAEIRWPRESWWQTSSFMKGWFPSTTCVAMSRSIPEQRASLGSGALSTWRSQRSSPQWKAGSACCSCSHGFRGRKFKCLSMTKKVGSWPVQHLLYRRQRLAIEFDGGNPRDRLVDDNRRQNGLVGAGYRLLRFTSADVYGKPAEVASQIRQALARD